MYKNDISFMYLFLTSHCLFNAPYFTLVATFAVVVRYTIVHVRDYSDGLLSSYSVHVLSTDYLFTYMQQLFEQLWLLLLIGSYYGLYTM